MKKKLGWGISIALAVYALLLAVLTAVESSHASSVIRSFADALWYSLVTITTVGYGDLYPVTVAGRLIGFIFLLLSVGVLAFIISAVYSLFTGRFWPGLILRAHRKRPWFLFSCMNAASMILAQNLAKEYPNSLQIFCNAPSGTGGCKTDRSRIFLSGSIEDALRIGGQCGPRSAFLMNEDELQNCDDAHTLTGRGLSLYCQGTETRAMPEVTFFNPCDSCARLFWQTHPLIGDEACVLLVGSGRYARSMLSSAIITNCRTPLSRTEYHLFGDWTSYLRAHHRLAQALDINCQSDGRDALFFHGGEWNANADLIARANRIIFCFDDADENVRCAQLLERCCAHSAAVYARTSRRTVPGVRFGDMESLYTPELVMKRLLDRAAMAMHDRYRQSTGGSAPAWNELTAFMRESNRAAADHIPTKIRLLLGEDEAAQPGSCRRAARLWQQAGDEMREICRRNEHDRWMRFYSLYNWQYAPERNNAARRHPCILPYEQLTEAERAKDDYAWQLLAECAEIQEQFK